MSYALTVTRDSRKAPRSLGLWILFMDIGHSWVGHRPVSRLRPVYGPGGN